MKLGLGNWGIQAYTSAVPFVQLEGYELHSPLDPPQSFNHPSPPDSGFSTSTHVHCAVQLTVTRKEDNKLGALMHVAVEGAQARLVVLPTDPTSTQAAMEFMARVDPPSEGVPMRQASTKHLLLWLDTPAIWQL